MTSAPKILFGEHIMVFSSLTFLFYFLPTVLVLYALSPARLKNFTLLAASLVFYAWGEPRYIVLMLTSILAGYVFALLIERGKSRAAKRVWLSASVVFAVGFLGYFKYANFFAENFAALTGLSVPLLKVTLPIGISFYTFQILSYTIDVYRGEKAQKNPINLAAYISLFPQLIAGPIVRYSDIAEQMTARRHSFEKCAEGIRRFIAGLAKKILIANTLGELCARFTATSDGSVLFYWLYAIAFMLQIYFDFSGYSDMAIGLGKILGFDFLENFNYPYISRSITEFWRRWHISLGSWFRDYVYIPLGGNRVGRIKHLRNIIAVWLLTGFWHGAEWNFVLWGAYFAVLLIAEKLWLGKLLERSHVLSRVYVLFAVVISFVIFSLTDLGQIAAHLSAMFGAGGLPIVSAEFVYCLRSYGVLLAVAAVGATPLPSRLYARIKDSRIMWAAEPAVLITLLVVCAAFLIDGSFNPFLYFRF